MSVLDGLGPRPARTAAFVGAFGHDLGRDWLGTFSHATGLTPRARVVKSLGLARGSARRGRATVVRALALRPPGGIAHTALPFGNGDLLGGAADVTGAVLLKVGILGRDGARGEQGQ
jgi:hypothetical protein